MERPAVRHRSRRRRPASTLDVLTAVGRPCAVDRAAGTIAVFDPQINVAPAASRSPATRSPATTCGPGPQFGFAVGQADHRRRRASSARSPASAGRATTCSDDRSLAARVRSDSGGTVRGLGVRPDANPVAIGGNKITVTGGGGPGPTASTPPTFTGTLTATARHAHADRRGSWITDGFVYGMVAEIDGVPGLDGQRRHATHADAERRRADPGHDDRRPDRAIGLRAVAARRLRRHVAGRHLVQRRPAHA